MRTVLKVFVVLFIALSLFAGDWPNFLGPNKNGISDETGLNKDWNNNPPKMLWKVSMHDNGFSGPSAAAGKLYIIDRRENSDFVRAIDINTGKDIWTFAYADPGGQNYGYARSTPTYDEGKLYIVGRKGQVYCLNAETGKEVWGVNIVQTFSGELAKWMLAPSPVIDGDRLLLISGGSKGLVILNKHTGKTIMRGGNSDVPGYATPVIADIEGEKQYVVFTGKHITGISPEDGSLLWKYPWETSHDVNAATPPVFNNKVFITSDYNRGCALVKIESSDASILWENRSIKAHFSSTIYYKGYLYGTSDPDHLVCVAPDDGSEMWKGTGFQKGGMLIADGVIIALGGRSGEAIMVEASEESYNELGRFTPLGGQSWTAPILAEGKLFIRNMSQLACFDAK